MSWSAWLGQKSAPESCRIVANADESADAIPVKRRPVSRLWSSFSAVGRDRSSNPLPADHLEPSSAPPCPPSDGFPILDADHCASADDADCEHIYEEIIDKPLPGGLTRAGRGSFAGATRQDILRYLEELRKKNPAGILATDRSG